MNEIRMLILDIESEESVIAEIYDQLSSYPPKPLSDQQTILVAYYLHNLYTAIEQSCVLIAKTFENQILDRSRWHSLLLKRMTLDIDGLRPRLFSDEAYFCLGELRAFRHVFRSMYKASLDPERLELVYKKAIELKPLLQTDLNVFKAFLYSISE